MKTRNLLMYAMVAFAFIATSCEKKDTADDNGGFSPIPVEQHKTNIEDAGFEMLDEIKRMENEPAIQANISLVNHLTMSAPFQTTQKNAQLTESILFSSIYASATYKNSGLKGILKLVMVNPAEDPISIQVVFDHYVGIYEWNFDYNEWSYTPTGDNIVFLFPSEDNGTSNNASYTISYVGYTGPNPIKDDPDSEYTGDLPQNFSAKLVVDAVEISAYLLDIVYGTDGIPTSIETSFSMGEFKLSVMASNVDNKAFNTEASFTNGSKILLKFVLGASGDWNQANIDANTHYYVVEWNENTFEYVRYEVSKDDNYDYEQFDIHKVITKGNASFQAMNIKVVGEIDAEKLGETLEEINSTDSTQEQMINDLVTALNQDVRLSLRYVDSDQIIALVEAYPIVKEYSYQTYYYDGEWHEISKTVTETYYDIGLRFIFADGSPVDSEVYFADIFTNLIGELAAYQNELGNKYAK